MKPKISILTTVYNGEKFIADTIKSVLNQTFKDFEYIIVDDGSDDRTPEIIEKYEKKDNRIRYYSFRENLGYFNFHRAINDGLEKCQGKYIARIDADDLMLPNRLQVQYDYLETHENIFMLGSSVEVINEKGNKIDEIIKTSIIPLYYNLRISFSNPFIHSSIMFRNVGLKYPYHNEHFFYFNMLINKKKIKNIKQILTKYRINPNGVMSKHADLSKNKYRKYYLNEITNN